MAFDAARRIASDAQGRSLVDFTRGARHYHATTIPQPKWARGHQPCFRLGKHIFYNDIA
jgi:spore germination cell wall hydrolase CwlJ-like protein